MSDQTLPEPDDLRDAQLRAALADVPSVPAAVKDAAIAAALAVYDAEIVGDGRGAAVVSLDSRRRWPTRLLTAAAAVAAVGVIGVTVLQGNKSNDKNSSTAGQYSDVMSASSATTTPAVGGASPSADSVLLVASPMIAVNSPEQLRDLVAAKVAPEAAADVTIEREMVSPAMGCLTEQQQFITEISYAGTPAIAVRDTVTGVIQAIDEQCIVLAEVKP